MTAAIVTDLEQTVYDRQRAARHQMVTAVRALPSPRTDVPLVPVPFATRMHSPLCDSLTPRPAKAYNRKLTDADAAEIRRRHAEGSTASELGRMYGVARQSVDRIVAGDTYRVAAELTPEEQEIAAAWERRSDTAIAEIRADHARVRGAMRGEGRR